MTVRKNVSQKHQVFKDNPSKWKVGTSGYVYNHWKDIFYPSDIPKSRWLEFYGNQFETVEVNATFYRLPNPKTFDNWYHRTPENFLWAVKGSKYITHTRRLKDPQEHFDLQKAASYHHHHSSELVSLGPDAS